MKLIPSNDYSSCVALAKKSMLPYFKEYGFEWNDEERLAICKEHDLYEIFDSVHLGFILFRKDEDKLFIADIQILSEFQGKGHGSRALSLAKGIAKSSGCTAILLKVFKSNPAIALYERNGFVKCGEEEYVYVFSLST